MKRYIKNIILAFLLFIVISIVLIFIVNDSKTQLIYKNCETESNLLIIPQNKKFDILFMGISHARIFARNRNNERVERILNKKVINLGRGSGKNGLFDLHEYLKYFYSEENNVDTILFFASPPLLFSTQLDSSSNAFVDEPINFRFIKQYVMSDAKNKPMKMFYYFKSKLAEDWLKSKPYTKERNNKRLLTIDEQKIEEGKKLVAETNEVTFIENCNKIEQSIILAKKNNTKFVMIIPPAIFGKWLGHKKIINFLDKMKQKHSVDYYDFSKSILKEPKYYYDNHHLNTDGVVYFTEKYLKPIFNNSAK